MDELSNGGMQMKAIITKCLPQTNTKPARIVAFDLDGNRIVVSADDADHGKAAFLFCQKMRWAGTLNGGAIKNGMAWVFEDGDYQVDAWPTK
jgi:hypothetical protein